ncbi:MAG: DUF5009 domain-containing protein [Bacteroidetes bacterium]|nr:DUF5009 domain-containing protein [Bacteroidota bacterium]
MTTSTTSRLLSLDVFRGMIMVLLMMESTRLYDHLLSFIPSETPLHLFFTQFTHHPWNGLRFWDLIQPGFMFIAGTALALSLIKQEGLGVSWNTRFSKVLRRSGWLFFWGVLDYAVRDHGLSFELWDVLTQLSFTTLVAFLIFNFSLSAQLTISFALLLMTEVLYRFTGFPDFDQPFVDQHNFGNYMDLVLMNKINSGGWVAINCLPTAAHTIWGAMAGKWLLSQKSTNEILKPMIVLGLIFLFSGYVLDFAGVTPIIKRIATSSFTLVSGGWCILFLTGFYWWIDVRNHRSGWSFFTIVGMNSLFIYLFFEIVGNRWFTEYLTTIVTGLMLPINLPEWLSLITASLVIFAVEWKMCQFLFRKGIFFKI